MRKALVIGINNYPSAPLNGCVKDAIEIANVLEKHSDGSPNFSVKLITDPGESATKPKIREAIEKLFEGSPDVALFYFSGHGLIKSTGGYLVTSDYKSYDEGISMDDILKIANRSGARDKVIILDCCHSGIFGNPNFGDSTIAQISDGITVLTACRDNEPSIEVNGGGVFTSLLLDAFEGGAADLRGNVTPGSVYAYVDEALGAWDQRPIFKTNVSKFVQLRKINPRVPIDKLRMIVELFPSPNEHFKLNPEFEDTFENHDMLKVKTFKLLQEYVKIGLVVPVDEEHMYYAAMNSKSCRLTAIGYQYWRLASENKL
jgi:hypothetical protein